MTYTWTWMASLSAIRNFQHYACSRNYLPSSIRSQPTGKEVEEGRGGQEPNWMGRLLLSVLRCERISIEMMRIGYINVELLMWWGGYGCGANYHYMTMPFNGVMFMMMHCSSWRLTV